MNAEQEKYKSKNVLVKHLLDFLNKQDPDAVVLISDGHEGISQMKATV